MAGNTSMEGSLRRPLIAFAAFACLVAVRGRAGAEPCPPAVTLRGEPALIATIEERLAARGIASDRPACASLAVEVEQRGETLIVRISDTGEAPAAPIERQVGEADTAATVIESFVRTDATAPLLAVRAVEREPAPALPPAPLATAITVTPAPRGASRGVQVFALAETSLGNDDTGWVGAQVGACISLGPVCAAARLRFATVTTGPGMWGQGLERRGNEVLLGGDIPLQRGSLIVSPGFAAGLGVIRTHLEGSGRHNGDETGGLRADVHVAVSYLLRHRLAIELTASADLTQATHIESSATTDLPDEPWLLGRLGLGLRYGGL